VTACQKVSHVEGGVVHNDDKSNLCKNIERADGCKSGENKNRTGMNTVRLMKANRRQEFVLAKSDHPMTMFSRIICN
jgi:hypothetical protein